MNVGAGGNPDGLETLHVDHLIERGEDLGVSSREELAGPFQLSLVV